MVRTSITAELNNSSYFVLPQVSEKKMRRLPKKVEALPMLAEVAILRRRGAISFLGLPCLMCSLSSRGVMTTHVASFVINAERTADKMQTFHSTRLNGFSLPCYEV